MKVGIITFHAAYNCGSILQCMALKEWIERAGYEVEIINFSSQGQKKLYSVFYKRLSLKNVAKNILCLPGKKVIENHYSQYKNFINNTFKLDIDEAVEMSSRIDGDCYDLVISGGDQVWNVNCEDFDYAYFLDFCPNSRKISYSPSLGATNINEFVEKNKIKDLLNQYNSISCREPNGKRWLEQLTGRNVAMVLDPTLLWEKSFWENKIDFLCKYKNFIFYYAFAYQKYNNEFIDSFARQVGKKVVIIDAKQWYIKRLYRYKSFVLSKETGPIAFLNYIKCSDYVFTSSFHGSVFCILFEKKFMYVNNINHESNDDRTSFLLKELGLLNKYKKASEITLNDIEEMPNYILVKEKLSKMQSYSKKYLLENLKDKK